MATKIYQGYEIELTDDMRFMVSGPDWGRDYQRFDSFREAKEGVDRFLKGRMAKAKAEKSLSIPALQVGFIKGKYEVQKITIKGIHVREKNLLCREPGIEVDSNVWPDVPWLRQMLEARAIAENNTRAINEKLRPYSVKAKSAEFGYGNLDGETYPKAIGQLEKSFADKRQAAENADPSVRHVA